MSMKKKRILSLVLVVVFSLCLCLNAFADASKTVKFSNKATVTVSGETTGGWWWWSNPSTTVTVKNNSSNNKQQFSVVFHSGLLGYKSVTLKANESYSVSITGSGGQGVKYWIEIKPLGLTGSYINNSYGSVTVTASSGTIR